MEDRVLEKLIDLVESKETLENLELETQKVLQRLTDSPEEPQAWQPLPTGLFGARLPDEVESAWLFALRSGGVFGNERHPNSWQRSIALTGVAEFDLLVDGKWEKQRDQRSACGRPACGFDTSECVASHQDWRTDPRESFFSYRARQ